MWGGPHKAIMKSAETVNDTHLSDPAVVAGYLYQLKPNNITKDTRNELAPSDVRVLGLSCTLTTGASMTTAGEVIVYFSEDNDGLPGAAGLSWDLRAKAAILNSGSMARFGYIKTVKDVPGDYNYTFTLSRGLRMLNQELTSSTPFGNLYCFFPRGLTPTLRVYSVVQFDGVDNTAIAPITFAREPAFEVLYPSGTMSDSFLDEAFNSLSRPTFFNQDEDRDVFEPSAALIILYPATGSEKSMLEVITGDDRTDYRVPLRPFLFPARNGLGYTMASALTEHCNTKIENPDNKREFWWAHCADADLYIASGADLKLHQLYQRSPFLGPNNRTAAEILSNAVAGEASVSVSAAARPAPEPEDLARLMQLFAPLIRLAQDNENAADFEDRRRNPQHPRRPRGPPPAETDGEEEEEE